MSVYVSLCLFLYVFLLIYQKQHVRTALHFMFVLSLAVALTSSDNNAVCHVFLVFWMMSHLHIICKAKAMRTGCILDSSFAVPGVKV